MTMMQSAVEQQSDALYVLLYRSHSLIRPDLAEAEVARILSGAKAKNAALHITGALMLYEDWFAQVLEGPEDAVVATFARIEADPRHDSVEVLHRDRVSTRAFERWRMAYVGEHGDVDIPMMPVGDTLAPAAPWRPRAGQEEILAQLRQATRGYGRGS